MNLSFMTRWPEWMPEIAGHRTMFCEQVWNGLDAHELWFDVDEAENHVMDYPFDDTLEVELKKLHTIRSGDRWKAGNKIHFKIWTGKAYRSPTYQFAPVLPCISTQEFEVKYIKAKPHMYIDGREILGKEIETVSENDGFLDVDHFWLFFKKDFKGQIIHWTKTKY